MDEGIGILVSATDNKGNSVEGWLTGTGAGKYTGLIVSNGDTLAVLKTSIDLII